MTQDMPETIWAKSSISGVNFWTYKEWPVENELSQTQYTRTDKYEALKQSHDRLVEKAQAVIDRWNTPLWKDVEPTAVFIHALRDAVAEAEKVSAE